MEHGQIVSAAFQISVPQRVERGDHTANPRIMPMSLYICASATRYVGIIMGSNHIKREVILEGPGSDVVERERPALPQRVATA